MRPSYQSASIAFRSLMRHVLTKRLTLRGFIVFDFANQQPEFLAEVGPLVRDGRIKYREDLVEGLEKRPAR